MSKPKKNKRSISGIFLLDKRQGISSNKALQEVRHCFAAEKAGHTGALDPMATGLLPICLGEATKFSHYLLDADKGYQTTIKLGQQTDTGDAEGNIIGEEKVPHLTEAVIQKVLSQFLGKQLQTPPMYSALKKEGKKLYELARAGIEVERPMRPIVIKKLELKSFNENSLSLFVLCSKGTYIRVLGEDIAKVLGTVGHLTMLRRTQTGHFKLENALTYDQLNEKPSLIEKDSQLLPSYAGIQHLPKIQLNETQKQRIQMGQRLNVFNQIEGIFCNSNEISQETLMFCGNQFLGLAVIEPTGRLQPKRIVKTVP